MRKCTLLSENLMKEGKSMDFVSATTEYINCFKKADKYKCPAKMLDHYIHTMDVYYQYLEEDKRWYCPLSADHKIVVYIDGFHCDVIKL